MSLPEIAVWAVVSTFLIIRVAMLVLFVAIPVIIARAIYRQSEA